MSVNEEIYRSVYKYLIDDSDHTSRNNLIAVSTVSLRTHISADSSWNGGTGMDRSNVYTTFNPDKFPGLFGATITEYNPVVTDPANQEDWNNTGIAKPQEHPPRVKEFSWEEGTPTRVNLRYVIANVGSAGTQPHYMYRWTNIDPDVKHSLIGTPSDSVVYEPNKGMPNNYIARYNDATQLNRTTNYEFVTDINRENVMLGFAPNFVRISDNSAYNIESISMTAQSSAPLGKPEMWEWFKTDETGIIEKDGQKFLCVGCDFYLFQKNVSPTGSITYFNGQYTGKKTSMNGTVEEDFPTSNSCCYALSILCERVVNGNYYYYTIPFTGFPNVGSTGVFYVNTADWANTGNYPALFPLTPQNRDTGNKYTFNPYNGFNGGMTLSDDPDDPNYTRGFSVFAQGSGNMTFNYEEPTSDYNINPNDTDHTRQWNQLKGKDVVSFGWSSGSTGIANSYYGFSQHIWSGKEIMAMVACFMIPAVYNYSNSSLTRFNKEQDEEYCIIGVRNADGSVSGDYIPYIWGETPVEKEMTPPDFEPFDPYVPVPPDPSPPDSDRTKGDTGTIKPAGAVSIGATSAFCTHYVLDSEQVTGLGKGLWGGVEPKEVLKNFWYFNADATDYQMSYSEILDYIVGLKYYPLNLIRNNLVDDPGEKGIRIGNGTTMIPDLSGSINNPWILLNSVMELDGGYVTIPHETSSFLDHEPCSVASVYVPFCGTAELKLSSVTGKELHLRYYIDLVSGCCKAIISMNGEDGEFPIAQLDGVCGFDVMLTGNNQNQQLSAIMSSYRQTALSVGGNIMSAIAGGVTGGMAGGAAGAVVGTLGGLGGAVQDIANTAINMPQTASLHPMSAGTSASLTQICGYLQAFVQVNRVITQTPSNYNSTVAYIHNQTRQIGQMSGYTQCVNPNLNGITATEQEKNMIYQILETGFYA